MTQIQAIFEHLQDIQTKLDREKNATELMHDKSIQMTGKLSGQSSQVQVQLMPHFPTHTQRFEFAEKKDNKNSKGSSMQYLASQEIQTHK
jgi:hypothetical protein